MLYQLADVALTSSRHPPINGKRRDGGRDDDDECGDMSREKTVPRSDTNMSYPALKIDMFAVNRMTTDSMMAVDGELLSSNLSEAHPSAVSVPSGDTEMSLWPPLTSTGQHCNQQQCHYNQQQQQQHYNQQQQYQLHQQQYHHQQHYQQMTMMMLESPSMPPIQQVSAHRYAHLNPALLHHQAPYAHRHPPHHATHAALLASSDVAGTYGAMAMTPTVVSPSTSSSPLHCQTPSKILTPPAARRELGSSWSGASPTSLQQRRSRNNNNHHHHHSTLKLALDRVVKESAESDVFFSMEHALPILNPAVAGGVVGFASPLKEAEPPMRTAMSMDDDGHQHQEGGAGGMMAGIVSSSVAAVDHGHQVWDGYRMIELTDDYRRDLNEDDIREDRKLGTGSSGDVVRVTHMPTGRVMAMKCVRMEAKMTCQRQILRELQVLRECHSPHIVSFHGAFFTRDGSINMCMEYMDLGSLDVICHELGGMEERVVGKIAVSILRGLVHLYDGFRIMHRDIKPSNILLNSRGEAKLCDFGVSGSLVNSTAQSFVGTSAYMAPERIQGCKYSIHSDVWSFGLTLLELATGLFPFRDATGGVFELMQEIVRAPAPRLPDDQRYSSDFVDFIDRCLTKDVELRPLPADLLHHPFIVRCIREDFDMRDFCAHVIVRRRQSTYDRVLSSARHYADFPIVHN